MRLKLTFGTEILQAAGSAASGNVHRFLLPRRFSSGSTSNIPWLQKPALIPKPHSLQKSQQKPAVANPSEQATVRPSISPAVQVPSMGINAVKSLFGGPSIVSKPVAPVHAPQSAGPNQPVGRTMVRQTMASTAAQVLMNRYKPGPVGLQALSAKASHELERTRQMKAQRAESYQMNAQGGTARPTSAPQQSRFSGQFGGPTVATGALTSTNAQLSAASGRPRDNRRDPFGKPLSAFGLRAAKVASVIRGRKTAASKEVVIVDEMTPRELAQAMGWPVVKVMRELHNAGEIGESTGPMDLEIAELIAVDAGMQVTRKDNRYSDRVRTEPPSAEDMLKAGMPHRAPVVTVMGHVDHGKTTLLDALRGSNVAEREAGGITQGIAAFSVAMRVPPVAVGDRRAPGGKAPKAIGDKQQLDVDENGSGIMREKIDGIQDEKGKSGKEKFMKGQQQQAKSNTIASAPTAASVADVMTFLDTPGHALFASMRQRGGSVTDVIVLVVDGKDGIMPQTKECVKLILNSGAPCVVAVTKCDSVEPTAACTRVGKQLLELGLATLEFGGEATMVAVSARTGLGLQELKDSIALQAEMLDLRADNKASGEAIVLDARIVQGQGQVVDCIVTWGGLKVGDVVVAGTEYGRIKALFTDATAAESVNKLLGSAAAGSIKKVKKDKPEIVTNVFELTQVKESHPGTPVRVMGLRGNPEAGVHLLVVEDEDKAKLVLEGRARRAKAREMLSVSAADKVQRAAEREAYKASRTKKTAYDLAMAREKKRGFLRRIGQPLPVDLELQPWETSVLQDPVLANMRTKGKSTLSKDMRQQGGQQSGMGMSFHTATSLAESESGSSSKDGVSAPLAGPIPMAFVVKADSSGSLAAVKDAMTRIGQQVPSILLRIVSSSVGEVTEKDVEYADEMKAHILAFATKVSAPVAKAAERRNVELRSSRVIYHLLDEALDLLASALPLETKEETLSTAEVKAVFDLKTDKRTPAKVAGCVIGEGSFVRTADVYRLLREGKVIHEGPLGTLQIVRDKVESVPKGKECGMSLVGWLDYVPGDRIVAVKQSQAKPKLEVRLD